MSYCLLPCVDIWLLLWFYPDCGLCCHRKCVVGNLPKCSPENLKHLKRSSFMLGKIRLLFFDQQYSMCFMLSCGNLFPCKFNIGRCWIADVLVRLRWLLLWKSIESEELCTMNCGIMQAILLNLSLLMKNIVPTEEKWLWQFLSA